MNPEIKHVDFDFMPNLDEFWKERTGLGNGSIYELNDGSYVMDYGSDCACCPGGRKVWSLDSTGKLLAELPKDFSYVPNVKTYIKFNIPERISKHYLKITI